VKTKVGGYTYEEWQKENNKQTTVMNVLVVLIIIAIGVVILML
jgi:uncharacterized membrane protein YkgB